MIAKPAYRLVTSYRTYTTSVFVVAVFIPCQPDFELSLILFTRYEILPMVNYGDLCGSRFNSMRSFGTLSCKQGVTRRDRRELKSVTKSHRYKKTV